MSTHRVIFEALVTTREDKDIPLAEALTAIDQHCPVDSFSAKRLSPDVVSVKVRFWVANNAEAAAKARETLESLNHHWPTDAGTIDGRPFKYIDRRKA